MKNASKHDMPAACYTALVGTWRCGGCALANAARLPPVRHADEY